MDVVLPKIKAQKNTQAAGFWIRLLAMIIDQMILNTVLSPLLFIFYIFIFVVVGTGQYAASQSGNTSDAASVVAGIVLILGMAVFTLISILINFFYYGWFYKNKGATPGKMLFKMKVIDIERGENISYGKTFLREVIGKFVSSSLLMIGYIIAGFRQDKRSLHDLIASTQVVKQSD